jgi:hypothetical protein
MRELVDEIGAGDEDLHAALLEVMQEMDLWEVHHEAEAAEQGEQEEVVVAAAGGGAAAAVALAEAVAGGAAAHEGDGVAAAAAAAGDGDGPAGADAAAAAGAGGMAKRGEAWPSWGIPGTGGGTLVFDKSNNSMAAHCGLHRLCRVNRVLRKKPLGFLVSFLKCSHKYDSKDAHFKARKIDADTGPGQRILERAWLSEQPLLQEPQVLERRACGLADDADVQEPLSATM